MSLEIKPLANMGASVSGLDLNADIPAVIQEQLRKAWWKYGVLLFPGRECGEGSHERQLKLSHVFGEDEPHTLPEMIVPEEPRLISVSYQGEQQTSAFIVNGKVLQGWLLWHQDESYTTNIPIGSLLRMVEVAEIGGETGYIDIKRAYHDLPNSLKERIDGLSLLHQLGAGLPRPDAFGMRGWDVSLAPESEFPKGDRAIPLQDKERFPVIESPLVVTHPYSGRKTMLLSPHGLIGVKGMSKPESDELMHELCDRVTQEKYQYIHKWEIEDMIVWDNWTVMHMGMGYPPGQNRRGYRTTIKGPTDERTGRVYQEDTEDA